MDRRPIVVPAVTLANKCDCGPHRNDGQTRWLILDLGELPCLINLSKLNPGPSGEDSDTVGQPRDVRSSCAGTR